VPLRTSCWLHGFGGLLAGAVLYRDRFIVAMAVGECDGSGEWVLGGMQRGELGGS
jgi:hypothetical protein